jgi:hypothetical protein
LADKEPFPKKLGKLLKLNGLKNGKALNVNFLLGASPRRGDRAIRSNSSAFTLGKSLRDFRFYPLRVAAGSFYNNTTRSSAL